MQDQLSIALSIMLGIGLAAACGLRVFLPLFVASVFAHFNLGSIAGYEQAEWIGSWPTMIALGIATVVELLSYYIPFVDHALDVVAVPLSALAGTLVAISVFAEMPQLYAWGIALIAGGGAAGVISAATAATRVLSTGATAGLGNSVVSTAETGGAIGLSVLAFVLPVLAFVLVLALLYVAWRVLRKVARTLRQ